MYETEQISRTGYNKLMAELTHLEKKELPEVRRTVAAAREEGDLKENGAYIYGRQRQGQIEGRIGELKAKLNSADIIDCTKVECDSAVFGTVMGFIGMIVASNQEKFYIKDSYIPWVGYLLSAITSFTIILIFYFA